MTEPKPDVFDAIDTQAADWFARKRSGAMSEAEACDFEIWLARDQAHREAYALNEMMWDGVGAVRRDPDILELRERAMSRRDQARRRLALWAAAACVTLAAGAGAWTFVRGGGLNTMFPEPIEQSFRTSVGQRTTVTLNDGSVVTLDTNTFVKTRETPRRRMVELVHGRARFEVAKDVMRPFTVVSGGKQVTATGTAFDVRTEEERYEVTLLTGRVHVEVLNPRAAWGATPVAEMSAGSRLATTDGRHWTMGPIDPVKDASWARGQLTFDEQPLAFIVAEMNRYSERKLVIDDVKIAERTMSGIYRAGDIDDFTGALEGYGVARVGEKTKTEIHLLAPKK